MCPPICWAKYYVYGHWMEGKDMKTLFHNFREVEVVPPLLTESSRVNGRTANVFDVTNKDATLKWLK